MKIQILSDLHLERQPNFVAKRAPGADVLVLAGDIGSYQPGSLLRDDDFGLGHFSPLRTPDGWKQVLYVPGNHEYDSLDFDRTHQRLRETCERLGITWLERETLTIGNVRFVGTTLWSDFDALAQDGSADSPSTSLLTEQLRQREKAFRAANYYLRKYSSLRNGERMLADAIRELGIACQGWLRNELLKPFGGTTVVVTHFAPSLRSADPRYGLTPGTAGFCNALDELFPYADVWLHGHLHCPSNYVVKGVNAGSKWHCQVLANPLGYISKGEQGAFIEDYCIDL